MSSPLLEIFLRWHQVFHDILYPDKSSSLSSKSAYTARNESRKCLQSLRSFDKIEEYGDTTLTGTDIDYDDDDDDDIYHGSNRHSTPRYPRPWNDENRSDPDNSLVVMNSFSPYRDDRNDHRIGEILPPTEAMTCSNSGISSCHHAVPSPRSWSASLLPVWLQQQQYPGSHRGKHQQPQQRQPEDYVPCHHHDNNDHPVLHSSNSCCDVDHDDNANKNQKKVVSLIRTGGNALQAIPPQVIMAQPQEHQQRSENEIHCCSSSSSSSLPTNSNHTSVVTTIQDEEHDHLCHDDARKSSSLSSYFSIVVPPRTNPGQRIYVKVPYSSVLSSSSPTNAAVAPTKISSSLQQRDDDEDETKIDSDEENGMLRHDERKTKTLDFLDNHDDDEEEKKENDASDDEDDESTEDDVDSDDGRNDKLSITSSLLPLLTDRDDIARLHNAVHIVEVILPPNAYPGHVLFVEVPKKALKSKDEQQDSNHAMDNNNHKIVTSQYIGTIDMMDLCNPKFTNMKMTECHYNDEDPLKNDAFYGVDDHRHHPMIIKPNEWNDMTEPLLLSGDEYYDDMKDINTHRRLQQQQREQLMQSLLCHMKVGDGSNDNDSSSRVGGIIVGAKVITISSLANRHPPHHLWMSLFP